MQVDNTDKKKLLFESLENAEKKLQGTCLEQKNDVNYNSRRKQPRDLSIERYKQKESIFKRPVLPINKCLQARKRPDYERHPENYQHYSLSDVSDLSDRLNSTAAFAFLRDMEKRKEAEQKTNSDEPEKIVFKNSTKLKLKEEQETEDSSNSEKKIRGNKFVMPEYVIGEKRQKAKKINISKDSSSSSKSKQMKLSHLNFHEEEEDE